jgi:hypothetical protein
MSHFKHYHCDASGKTPLQLMRQYRVRQVRNKRPYENLATCPECGKLVPIEQGKLENHHRN